MEGCHDEAMDQNDPDTPLFIVDGLDRLVRRPATLSKRSGATARPRGQWATRRAPGHEVLVAHARAFDRRKDDCRYETVPRNRVGSAHRIVDGRVSSGGSLRGGRYEAMKEEQLISPGHAVFLALVFAMVLRVVS